VSEVAVDVEFPHPPERVWRALTDRELLGQWFAETDLDPHEGARFRVPAAGLPGFDGPVDGAVLEVDEPHRLVLRWGDGERPTRLTWELVAVAQGCRLALHHCEIDDSGDVDLAPRLREAYDKAVGKRLPAVLDRLAAQEAADRPARRDRTPTAAFAAVRRSPRTPVARFLVATAAVLLAVAAVGVAFLLRPVVDLPAAALPADAPPVPTGTAAARVTSSATTPTPPVRSGEPQPSRSVSASPVPAPTVPASPQATLPPLPSRLPLLTARYATIRQDDDTHRVRVAVVNEGTGAAPTWRVTVTLAPATKVTGVEGAAYRQDGDSVSFVPVAPAGRIAPDATASFAFTVAGDRQFRGGLPLFGCTVGDRPCEKAGPEPE
jgi:uncharacterized protein YndB with AHSA1/START domain